MKLSSVMKPVYEAAKMGASTARLIVHRSNGFYEVKEEQDGSHHSLVSEADMSSQQTILRMLRTAGGPPMQYVCEEEATAPDIVAAGQTGRLFDGSVPFTVFIDPLDGSASATRNLTEWSVAVNVHSCASGMVGGVVVAPDFGRDGLTVVGDHSTGTFCESSDTSTPARVSVCTNPKKAHIFLGVDVLKRRQFTMLAAELANACQTAHLAPSCALGCALVAIGRSDAILQPAQWPWDWAAAPALIIPAGGVVVYYHYRTGKPERLVAPDTHAFNGVKAERIGFIAGAPHIVEWIWQMLEKHWIELP